MSKGERQNVLIARALMAEPEILLLDEPCTGLDILAREQLLSTLRSMAQEGRMTIVYVTHHTDEILTDVFPKALLLKEGLAFAKGKRLSFSPLRRSAPSSKRRSPSRPAQATAWKPL